ncbi:MAG: ABC transporter permease [Terriglobales bacterium]
MLRDLRYAFRMLGKTPGFTAVALLTLALGIGANTAIFTLVNAALLRALPVPQPAQLAVLTDPTAGGTSFGTSGGVRGLLGYPEYLRLRDNNTVFSGLLAAQSNTDKQDIAWNVAGRQTATEQANTKMVSGNYFRVLGVGAAEGRTITPDETARLNADPVAVMSYAYWTQHFGRAAGVVGRQFQLHGHAFTVIGIMPKGFFGENVGDAPDLWVPLTMQAEVQPGQDMLHDPPGVSRWMWLQVIGRMKPGVTLQQAQANAATIFAQSVKEQAAQDNDANDRRDILGQKLQLSSAANGTSSVRGQFHDPLLALFALVGLVLLLAVVNLASLLLARGAARQKEVGVRLALGAGRGRVIKQLLTESVLLALIGGALGVLLALWGERLLLGLVENGAGAITLNLAPDLRVLGFALVISLLCGVLFGLAPAWRLSRLNLNATLQAEGRGGTARSRHVLGGLIRGGLPLGRVLVIGQVAISIVLLVGAALFARSLEKLNDVPLGFQAQHLLLTGVAAGPAGYKNATAAAYYHRLLRALEATPGIRGAALAEDGLFAHSESGLPIQVAGFTAPGGGHTAGARFDSVSADYFKTTGIPILLGRALTEQDATSAVKYAVINQTMAKQFFGNRNPIGAQLDDMYPDDKGTTYTVVGVAADAKYNSLAEKTPPRFYLSIFNGIPADDLTGAYLFVRGGSSDASTMQATREVMRRVDANVRVQPMRPMAVMIGRSLTTQQMLAKLSGFFGVLALLLAAIGLYGVMAYGVGRRTAEIGVRMALGAGRGAIVAMVLGEAMVLAAAGIVIGVPLSVAATKAISSQIHFFNLNYYDPASLAAAAVLLAGVAALAAWLPARRASRVDPLTALRQP